jgi:hypothetical protein
MFLSIYRNYPKPRNPHDDHLDLIVYVFSGTLSGTKANQVSVQVAARIQGPDHAGAFTGSRSCVFEIYRILRAS